MEYRVYFDDVLLDDTPGGMNDITIFIERDPELVGIYYKYTSNLKVIGDGYTDLITKYNASFCGTVDVEIQWKCGGDWETLFTGIIMLTKVKFNLNKCEATVSVADDTISARLANNWRISGFPQTDKSLSGATITPATGRNLQLFNPMTGTYSYTNRLGYSVGDIFAWLLAYYTDGEVEFVSDTFGSGGDWEHLYVLTGNAIHTTGGDPPEVSFYDLYTEVNKKIPLGFWVERSGGTTYIRVEERSYFYGSGTLLTHRNIQGDEGLVASIEEANLFAYVRIGAQEVTLEGGTFGYPDTRWFGWTEEEYGFDIACNIDNELDLTNLWFIDSNTIEDIVVNNSESYETELFLIEGERTDGGVYRAIKYSDGISNSYYNRLLTNYEVAQRWSSYLPGSFTKWLEASSVDNLFSANPGTDDGPFAVGVASTTINAEPYPFDTESYDNGGNYDNTTYRYTLPANGEYVFALFLDGNIDWTKQDQSMTVVFNIKRYDGGGTLLETYTEINVFSGDDGSNANAIFTTTVVGLTDHYIEASFTASTNSSVADLTVESGSYFRALGAPDTVVSFVQAETPRAKLYNYSYPMSKTDLDTVAAALNNKIVFNEGDNTDNDKSGHISKITYRPNEGLADIELLSQ